MEYLIEPWAHQKEAIKRAEPLNEFALFFQVGTGKTCAAINILRHKYAKHKVLLPTLVLCPPIVINNWAREFRAHSKVGDKVVCLSGKASKRLDAILKTKGSPSIFITNYETLGMEEVFAALMNVVRPKILVCDESHRLKNRKAIRTKHTIKLADQALYRYILTGTPVLNTPMDLWSQFRVLDKDRTFDKNFFVFQARYFIDKNAGMPKAKYHPNWVIRPGAYDEISRLISRKSMLATKAECLDLPPLVRKTVEVELGAKKNETEDGSGLSQAKAYKEMRNDLVTYLGSKACVATLAITKGLRLMQIVSGYMPVEDEFGNRSVVTFEDNPRLEALKELLGEITTHSKCLVWAVFKENYRAIRQVCKELGVECVEVHGEVSQKNKMDAVDRFNTHPECRVLIGHPASGGIGINLVSASYSIFYSRNFSLEQDLQAEARNYRGGSEVHEKITRIDLVSPKTIDEMVLKKLADKIEISDKVLKDMVEEI